MITNRRAVAQQKRKRKHEQQQGAAKFGKQQKLTGWFATADKNAHVREQEAKLKALKAQVKAQQAAQAAGQKSIAACKGGRLIDGKPPPQKKRRGRPPAPRGLSRQANSSAPLHRRVNCGRDGRPRGACKVADCDCRGFSRLAVHRVCKCQHNAEAHALLSSGTTNDPPSVALKPHQIEAENMEVEDRLAARIRAKERIAQMRARRKEQEAATTGRHVVSVHAIAAPADAPSVIPLCHHRVM